MKFSKENYEKYIGLYDEEYSLAKDITIYRVDLFFDDLLSNGFIYFKPKLKEVYKEVNYVKYKTILVKEVFYKEFYFICG